MRKPFKKHLHEVLIEEAHGGSGRRQLILSKEDTISNQLQAMTKGYLAPGAAFDWHSHEDIDELIFVLKGGGVIFFEDETNIKYGKDDLVYVPGNAKHRIEALGMEESEFFFIRINN